MFAAQLPIELHVEIITRTVMVGRNRAVSAKSQGAQGERAWVPATDSLPPSDPSSSAAPCWAPSLPLDGLRAVAG